MIFFRCTEQGWTWEKLSDQPDRTVYRSLSKVKSAARELLVKNGFQYSIIGTGRYTN